MLKNYFLLFNSFFPLFCVEGYISFKNEYGEITKNLEISYIESTRENVYVRHNNGFLKRSTTLTIPCKKLLSVNVNILGKSIKTNCPNNCLEGDCIDGYGELEYEDKGIYKGLFDEGKPAEKNNYFPYPGWRYDGNEFLKLDQTLKNFTLDVILTFLLFVILGIIMYKIKQNFTQV